MKRKIRQAFEHQTPDVLENVLSACENEKGETVVKKEKWQNVAPRKPKKFSWVGVAAMAAMIALIAGIGFAVLSGREQAEPAPQTQMQYDNGTETLLPTEPTETTESTETTETDTPTEIEWDIPSLVAKYNIAPARAELVLKALIANPEYSVSELIETDIETLIFYGANSDEEDYPIGYKEAEKIVLEYSRIENLWNYEIELVDGSYEIRFHARGLSYFYRVDATTGEVRLSRSEEDAEAADEYDVVKATMTFMEDFTPMTFLGENRDLTPHLVDSDAEIWANALHFLPMAMTRYYYDEFWLTNQRDYILQYAEYWRDVRKDTVRENVQIDYYVSKVHIFGDFAQIYLSENKSFYYAGETMDSFMEDVYEIMLINEDGAWKVFDLAAFEYDLEKYPNGQPQPPLVTEAYSASYVGRGQTTWYQSMPQIMINSEYAQQINEFYYEWANSMRTWEHTENAEGVAQEYDWYVHGDLLTIVVKNTHTGVEPAHTTTVYTLRISDGAQATREEILAAAGVSEETFREKAHPLIANTFGTTFSGDSMFESIQYILTEEPTTGNTHYQQIFGRTVSQENLQDAILYLAKDGTLCFQVKIYQFAGADYHEREYRIDDVPEKSPCYDILMEYSVGREFPIDDCICRDALNNALALAEATSSEISDLACYANYSINDVSYYRICFTLQDVPHTYYFTVDTCEPIYELT